LQVTAAAIGCLEVDLILRTQISIPPGCPGTLSAFQIEQEKIVFVMVTGLR
jgi:hypothetical protein